VFDSFQQSAGREYTATVALLAVAFIFIPALVAISQPLIVFYIWAAIVGFTLCVALAVIRWKRSAKVSIPAVPTHSGAAK
jgi:hypothetical protein